MEKGYIKLSRKFFSNELWKEARTFSSCEAWLDLIQSARFDATPQIVSIGGREVSYKRGQFPASIRFLSQRWSWTDRKVRTFLSFLKKKEMIKINNEQGMNIIILCKYEEYNSCDTVNDTASDTDIILTIKQLQDKVTQLTTQSQKKRHTGDTKNNKGENNNKYNIPPHTPPGGDGINYKARLIFENHFKTTFENNYYWTAKDAGSMDGLLQKLKFSRKQKKLSEDDESVLNALQAFLSSIQEGWIFENFSVSNLNSKFNEIVSSTKAKENKLKKQKGGDNGATRKDFNNGTVDQTTGETPKNYKKRF